MLLTTIPGAPWGDRIQLILFVSISMLMFSLPVLGQCEQQKLTPPGGMEREFGESVAVEGDLALVGDSTWPGCRPGSVFVHRWDGEAWVEEVVLTASDGAGGDYFGGSVSLSGDLALVGAPGDDDAGFESGSAYLFRHDAASGAWAEETKLTASDGSWGDRFGWSVSLSGDLALVGAPSDDSGFGSAYLFRHDAASGTWVEEAKLTASDGATGDTFGGPVSLSGDLALVAATGDDDAGPSSGSAYLFRYDSASGTWMEEAKLTASDGASRDIFGGSVSLSGDLALVGAYRDDADGCGGCPPGTSSCCDVGSAYMFRHDVASGTWVQEAKLTASDGEGWDRFGVSVLVNGDLALVGAYLDDDAGSASGSAYLFRYFPGSASWAQEAKLTPSDGAAGDFFGMPVSLSGDLALVGAPGDDDSGLDFGSAYVFRFDGASWAWPEEAKLTPPAGDDVEQDELGFSVSLSGDLALVGAYRDDEAGSRSGSAYVFRHDPASDTWVEDAKLAASDGTAWDEFGSSVSLSGDLALVGAPEDDDAGWDAGSAYVFRYEAASDTWVEEAKLTAFDAAQQDFFGQSVSVSGDLALVGAYLDDGAGGGSGSAYLFRYEAASGTWAFERKLTASDAAVGAHFGQSVSLSGDLALVGAPYGDDPGLSPGAAYVFRYDPASGIWSEEARLTASDGASFDSFGASVSLSGGLALVGAYRDDDAGHRSGSAYLFRYDPVSGIWAEEAKLTASDETAWDEFGRFVSLSGDLALVGAPFDDDAGADSGSAYVFHHDPASGAWEEEVKLTASDGGAEDELGWSLSLSGDLALVGAPGDDDACAPLDCVSCNSGAAYCFDLSMCMLDPVFMRGDGNGDGVIDIADPIHNLTYLFIGTPALCLDSQDTNDDGTLDVADPVYGIAYLFADGPPPPEPFAACGLDPTDDDSGCAAYPGCP